MVPTEVIDDINKIVVLTDRVKRRKEECFNAVPHVDAEKSHLITEGMQETEGDPLDIRRAKAFRKVMEGISVVIREGELIVGSQSKYIQGTSPAVDYNPVTSFELAESRGSFSLASRGGGGRVAAFSDEERLSILEDARYWKGKAPREITERVGIEVFGDKYADLFEARVLLRPDGAAVAGRLPNFRNVLYKGLNGIIAEAKEQMGKSLPSIEGNEIDKYYFLKAVIIACEGAIKFAQRYAALARELAGNEKDAMRKKELEKIADICQWVPANPARSFREALQSCWFIHLCMNLEAGHANDVPGRMDQYLHPFYKRDLEEGRLTRQEAAELLGCLWVKFSEMVVVKATSERERSELNQGQNMTIGGVDSDGRDASNELTYMFLEVARQVRTPQPPLYVRCHKGTPEELWMKAAEVNRERGDGVPAFLNDEAEVPFLVSRGMAIQDARDWAATGCVYGIGPGFPPDRDVTISHAKILELTLNNGVDPKSGKQLGLSTGDARNFSSFEELYEAFKKQDEYFIGLIASYHRLFWQARNKCYSLPFNSALIDDCIIKGKNFFAGGSRYPQLYWGIKDRGHQNVADSFVVIKKLVFEEKKISMDRLLKALKANFEGDENEVRRMCLAAPKYGNDDDYVDDIFNDFALWSQRRIDQEKHALGVKMRSGRGGATTHALLGKTIGALPDGRKSGEPLADGSLSPMRGADLKGPTAVINSASKINHTEEASYTLFNMKIMPSLLKTQNGLRKFIALVKTYFNRGGYMIQFNIMGQQVLLEAKKHPEQYRDLLVRVAGYSAYFVELSAEIQDDIVSRTEHTM